jgi:predicted ATP-grasp superfamily ATP-dependent carboligase
MPSTDVTPIASPRGAATVLGVQQPAEPADARHLHWSRQPQLRRPIIVAAFEGWNDAGDAASTAVRHLRDRLGATPFASVDPEMFFDFTTTRPVVELDDHAVRTLRWPSVEICATGDRDDIELITILGIEPQLRWRTFCNEIVDLARTTNAHLVLTLGALLAEVAHTRPTSVFGTSYDEHLALQLGLEPSRYEGPTGIVGVLHNTCIEAGIPSASLWAGVPSYVPGATSPKAALALVHRVGDFLGARVPSTDLEIATAAYERQVTRLVEEDEETAAYVEQLEDRFDNGEDDLDDLDDLDDADEVDADSLVEEVEQFLRNQHD